jgi:hypothetical protein
VTIIYNKDYTIQKTSYYFTYTYYRADTNNNIAYGDFNPESSGPPVWIVFGNDDNPKNFYISVNYASYLPPKFVVNPSATNIYYITFQNSDKGYIYYLSSFTDIYWALFVNFNNLALGNLTSYFVSTTLIAGINLNNYYPNSNNTINILAVEWDQSSLTYFSSETEPFPIVMQGMPSSFILQIVLTVGLTASSSNGAVYFYLTDPSGNNSTTQSMSYTKSQSQQTLSYTVQYTTTTPYWTITLN